MPRPDQKAAERDRAARAITFYEECDDLDTLREALAAAAPRARQMVGALLRSGKEEAIPGPADIEPDNMPATREEALATIRSVKDFAILQAITRSIGNQAEALRPEEDKE